WLGPPQNDSKSAIEWAGEWTVTYETFRDMGAAFAVALVLIYILVVWEFGNFRIPALIMAPIPLTLLGIIPAHFIFFQAGWGGEFTATSMIGWIALAGIIVRNSILLVDFSIHQVQQGTSVVDAVIMACTTRTRPIMITAFALVCGSSVIFFDPIFQGMAISLASGVLVSTILTLIVIPLGCIAASKDIIEVATATAPEGSSVAQEVETPMAPPVAAETHTAAETKHEAKDSLPIVIWAKFIAVVSILFYLIRGIFLLIGQLVKGLFRRGKSQQQIDAKGKGTATGGGGSSSGSNSGGVAPDGNASVDEDNESIAAAPVRKRATASPVIKREAKTDAESEQKTVLTPPAAKVVARKAKSGLATPTKQSKTQLTEASEVVETRAGKPTKEVKKQAVSTEKSSPGSAAKQRKRPSTLKKQVVKKKAAAAKSKGNGTPEKASSTKPTTKRASNVTNFPIRKKAVRRGIRLK
ncbi:MAG: efflux RND transporter permease subunit, partial [Candidatus Thiodiazotropha sp. (ex Lucinoma annulata)]|nr:efflux RND transporter permease subunit [Candidatus Thiodiazotropha sp. (ex Lucinoma annulata)]